MEDKKLEIPGEAISFIVSRYLREKNTESGSLVVGIPGDAVETVLVLFFEWAKQKNMIKEDVLVLGDKFND